MHDGRKNERVRVALKAAKKGIEALRALNVASGATIAASRPTELQEGIRVDVNPEPESEQTWPGAPHGRYSQIPAAHPSDTSIQENQQSNIVGGERIGVALPIELPQRILRRRGADRVDDSGMRKRRVRRCKRCINNHCKQSPCKCRGRAGEDMCEHFKEDVDGNMVALSIQPSHRVRRCKRCAYHESNTQTDCKGRGGEKYCQYFDEDGQRKLKR